MERFNVKKLNKVENKEQYRVEISNKFGALENLKAEEELGKLSERISKFQPKRI
jgi:hypothetical protein